MPKQNVKMRFKVNNKMDNIIRSTAWIYYRKIPRRMGYTMDDLVQEGRIVGLKAQRTWEPDKGSTFKTYLVGCLRNRYKDILSHSFAKMRSAQGGEVSYDDRLLDEGEIPLEMRLAPLGEDALMVVKMLLAGKERQEVRRAVCATPSGFKRILLDIASCVMA